MSDLIKKTIKLVKGSRSSNVVLMIVWALVGAITIWRIELLLATFVSIFHIVVFALTNVCLKKLQNALEFRYREDIEDMQEKLLLLLIGDAILFWPIFVVSLPLIAIRKNCKKIILQWSTFCQVESTADDNSTDVGEE